MALENVTAKELIVVGGPNGAGKSTFANEYVGQTKLPFIGADDIASKISPTNPAKAQIAASREFLRQIDSSIQASSSFVVESTLSGLMFRRFLQKAHRAGFQITIVYLFLESVEICLDRVQERVQKGGHFVPENDVRRRFSRSLSNFWSLYRPLADQWLLIYNSGSQPQDIAVGSTTDISIRDVEMFSQFQRLVDTKS